MQSSIPRHSLLRQAFSSLPKQVGPFTLRPLSGGSFELLHDLKNPLVFGAEDGKMNIKTMLSAVHEFVYIHMADIDVVSDIKTAEDIDPKEVRKISMQLEIGECLELTTLFAECSLRMAAAMTEPADDDEAARPGKPQTLRTGSLVSSLPAEPLATPSESVTSSGLRPSREPSSFCTPQPCNLEPDAVGARPLFALPTMTPQILPAPHFPPCGNDFHQI